MCQLEDNNYAILCMSLYNISTYHFITLLLIHLVQQRDHPLQNILDVVVQSWVSAHLWGGGGEGEGEQHPLVPKQLPMCTGRQCGSHADCNGARVRFECERYKPVRRCHTSSSSQKILRGTHCERTRSDGRLPPETRTGY